MGKLRNGKSEAGTSEQGERLASLDALRGVLLLLVLANGFGLRAPENAQPMLDPERWGWITNQFAHREWQGCTLWDLLQPGFLLIVGIAMPYSYAQRQARGQGWPRQFLHALKRAVILLVLGLYLDSYRANRLVFDLRGDLQQIGLAYFLAFLVLPLGRLVQGLTVGFLLIGHTAAHVTYALAGGHEFWAPTANVGAVLDQWLHFAPHAERFVTLNVLPSTALVLLGVLIGGLLRSDITSGHKVAFMTAASAVGILFGWLLGGGNGWIDFSWFALLPIIPRLETWTFVFLAAGWALLFFTYFYLLMDAFALQGWAVPLTLVGRNALILSVASCLFRDWAVRSAMLVLPGAPPILATLRPLFVALIVLLIFWLLGFWLYRRRIFVKA